MIITTEKDIECNGHRIVKRITVEVPDDSNIPDVLNVMWGSITPGQPILSPAQPMKTSKHTKNTRTKYFTTKHKKKGKLAAKKG